ncbi:MAG: hypothetical protein ACI8QD_001523 [Cyclobacteriaceae bacterium]|jgi:hypothetical protein
MSNPKELTENYNTRLANFQISNYELTIGTPLAKLKKLFPNSFAKLEEGSANKILRIFHEDTYVNFVIKNERIVQIFTARHS